MKMNYAVVLASGMIAFLVTGQAFGNPVAHYTFDNSGNRYADASGNGYDGTVGGSGTTFVSSGIAGLGDAMQSTTSGRVLVNTPIPVGLDSFAISFWATSGTDWDNWIAFDNDALTLQQYTGGGTMFFNNDGGVEGCSSYVVGAGVNGSLQHYVFSADSTEGTVSLYLNGSLANAGDWTVSASETINYLTIGGSRNTTVRDISAKIDDVQVYDTALSAGDVSILYTNPGTVIPEPATLGLAALFGVGILASRRIFMM